MVESRAETGKEQDVAENKKKLKELWRQSKGKQKQLAEAPTAQIWDRYDS